ncbi:hypothetical protein QBC45DRAFT_301373, partial [Copromyces sp. CBS 386.78]
CPVSNCVRHREAAGMAEWVVRISDDWRQIPGITSAHGQRNRREEDRYSRVSADNKLPSASTDT